MHVLNSLCGHQEGSMLARLRRFTAGFVILAACLLAMPSSADTQLYTVTDLGTVSGATNGMTTVLSVTDINDAGDVVGCAGMFLDPVSGQEVARPFVYTNGELRQITDKVGCAYGINDSGQVTGYAHFSGATSMPEAFAYENGSLRSIGALPGYSNQPYAIANGINNAGTIVGESKAEAMIYENGEMKGFGRHSAHSAQAINDAGDIIGFLATPRNTGAGFLFRANQMEVIAGFEADAATIPAALNSRGQVVGYTTILGIPHAFVYENGVTSDFLAGRCEYSSAADINDAGEILVGCGDRGYLYRNGDLIDIEGALGDAGPFIAFGCSRMNDRGQLACSAWLPGSGRHVLRLTPIQPPQ
jgi:probable HAF family extracellular repeat protein